MQEPYVGSATTVKSQKGVRIYQSTDVGEGTVKAAVAVFDQNLTVKQYPKLTTNNIAVVGIQTSAWEIAIASLYFEPEKPIEPYLEQLTQIKKEIKTERWIVGGDINAKSLWWGSDVTDGKGEEFSAALDEMGFNILNRGKIPTFDTVRNGKRYRSYVDVTACTTNILDQVDNWKVDEGLVSSDHNGITFDVKLEKSKGTDIIRTTRIFNTKKANWPEFREKLISLIEEHKITKLEMEQIKSIEEMEIVINKINSLITEACKESIPCKKSTEKITVPWWSKELAKLKSEVATRRRRIRCAAPVRRPKVIAEYLKHKEKYQQEIAKAQIESWREFCTKQDKEGVWDGIYRVIGRTTRREEDLPLMKDGKSLDAEGSVKLIAETFYTDDPEESDNDNHRLTRSLAEKVNEGGQDDPCDPWFTMAELEWAVGSFNPKKAPGAEGFTADICDRAIKCNPQVFLAIYNKCLALNYFPTAWKEATVVILRKPGKDSYVTPKSYRPIGLLPVLGKIYEKMLVSRLKFHLLPKISTRQYGFMPQKSTEDSLYNLMSYIRTNIDNHKIVTLISLDIEGAFDNAWWPAIRVRLAEENCPINLRRVMDSYLTNRKVNVRYAGKEFSRDTSKGCVQGSIGGPILWNLLLNPLLRSLEEREVFAQAFADDIVLLFCADTALQIERQANAALEHVLGWGVENKLKFAPQKTSAMVITKKLKFDTPRLSMGGTGIGMSKEIKILGVTIDNKLTFNTHVANVCKKAIGVYKHLSKAAKVGWGLHPEVIKLIYTATIEPIVLYAASVWAPAANKICVVKRLGVVQRGIAQKMCKAYRTVSLSSVLALSGILPLDLRVKEAATLYRAKKGYEIPELKDREVERQTSALEAPHPALRTAIEFVCLGNQEELDNNTDHQVLIYTDGSKIEGKVGAALSIWKDSRETKSLKLVLPHYCTVYQAELLALHRATKEILKSKATSFGVYSDSRAALQTVTNFDSLHPLAVKSRSNIKEAFLQSKSVCLFWIKAHIGMEGNERADELAKEAALHSKRRPDYELCPVSFVKRIIRTATIGEWNVRYSSGETASVTKSFFPNAVSAYAIARKTTPNSLTTQVLTGHGGFSEYLHRFKCKESPSCICDPSIPETVEHVLTDCPVHIKDRYDAEQEMDIKIIRQNFPRLASGKQRLRFLEYCEKVCKIVNNRNKK